MVNESNCKDLHADLCSNHSLFDQNMGVTSNEMEDVIKDLSYNKSPGLDGISGQQLPVFFFFYFIFSHFYVGSMCLMRRLHLGNLVLARVFTAGCPS